MVNAYIIYKENFKIMNTSAPQNPLNPLAHDKFMSGVIHKLIGNFSCCRQSGPALALPFTLFHQRNHDSVSLIKLGLLKFGRCHHCCIFAKGAKRKETGFSCRTCMKYLSFWLPWTIPQAAKYLLNIAANYMSYKIQEFFYFPPKFVMFYGNLSNENRLNYINICKFIELIRIMSVQIWNILIHHPENKWYTSSHI